MENQKVLLSLFLLLLITPYNSDALLFQGVSQVSWQCDYEQVKELGSNSVHLRVDWNIIEPNIVEPVPSVEQIKANPVLIKEYAKLVNWAPVDQLTQKLAEEGLMFIPWVGQGLKETLPLYRGAILTPEVEGNDFYLGCAYRHVRALQERYCFPWVQVEGELNEAMLAQLFRWRIGDWYNETFLTALIQTLTMAVKDAMPNSMVGTSFHTDIHSNIHHHTSVNPSEITGEMIAGQKDWQEWLVEWKNMLDFIALDCYPYYYNDSFPGEKPGVEIGERVRLAKQITLNKPIILTETAYPVCLNGQSPYPVNYTKEKQAEFAKNSLQSAIENGAEGIFWFCLSSPGITEPPGGYTNEDLETLKYLGVNFRSGNAKALIDYALSHLSYVQGRLFTVLSVVENGWGILRNNKEKLPAFWAVKEVFSKNSASPPYQQILLRLDKGMNFVGLPIKPLKFPAAQIENKYFSIWQFKDTGWRIWEKDQLYQFSPNPGQGFLIHMKEAAEVTVYGNNATAQNYIQLNTGWNLISPFGSKMVNELPKEVRAVYVYEYKQGGWQFNSPLINFGTLKELLPKIGYWLWVEKPCQLNF